MTKVVRLQVEQSQLRQKINERLGEDELTDEQRADLDQWTTRAQEVEVEHYGRGRERDPSLSCDNKRDNRSGPATPISRFKI